MKSIFFGCILGRGADSSSQKGNWKYNGDSTGSKFQLLGCIWISSQLSVW